MNSKDFKEVVLGRARLRRWTSFLDFLNALRFEIDDFLSKTLLDSEDPKFEEK